MTASGTGLTQGYDGDGLRVKKVEQGETTYYLRSSVLGSRVVAELNGAGAWTRGYVYLGGQLLAIQANGVRWVHQDPITKSQRVTDANGAVTTTQIDLDPWGGETSRSADASTQPQRYTTYTRDTNGGDEAMLRRYSGAQQRFSQPDPYDGSYSLTNPQSFNRYSYVQSDPVNFTDPTGLLRSVCYTFQEGGEFEKMYCFSGPGFDGYNPREPNIPEPQNPGQDDPDEEIIKVIICAPKYETPPRGYINFNVTPIIPVGGVVGVGPSIGFLFDGRNIWPSFGGALGTTGRGVSVTASTQSPSRGWSFNAQAAAIVAGGVSIDQNGGRSYETGIGTPGVQVGFAHTFGPIAVPGLQPSPRPKPSWCP